MTGKTLYHLTEEQWTWIMGEMAAIDTDSGRGDRTPEQEAVISRVWEKLAGEMGFVPLTAEPGPEERTFYATSNEQAEANARAHSPAFRYNGD